MKQSHNQEDTYLGYKSNDYTTNYAKYYDETIAPAPMSVAKALNQSPYPTGTFPPLSKITDMMQSDYASVETGYSIEADGSVHVAVLTKMPHVLPKMWDWWFGWHGDLSNKYKLWHPKMHLSAEWQDGQGDTGQYIGRTSMIEEYITPNKLEKANIRFIPPSELCLTNDEKQVFICARVGYTHFPMDMGWLVHQVRSTTEGGAEMRSRFFLAGQNIQLRMRGWLPKMLSKGLQKVGRLPKDQAHYLLIHCAEEMNHLAAFLPELYAKRID